MNRSVERTASTIADILPNLKGNLKLGSFSKYNITASQHVALMLICTRERCTMGEISKSLGVTMPTVTGIINRLVKLGLVARVASPEDRRKVYVELSKKGIAHIAEVKNMARSYWVMLLTPLTPKEVEIFRKIWLKVDAFIRDQREKNAK
ncbi:MarR family winged helix-turn-helix transcriptional regulator [Candidatus Omnitrophota bacterium]